MLEAEADGVERGVVVFFLFDDEPFDGADLVEGGEERGEIDRAEAEFFFVLQVDERDAAALLAEEGGGILAADVEPVDVGLAGEVLRRGGVEDPIERGAAGDGGAARADEWGLAGTGETSESFSSCCVSRNMSLLWRGNVVRTPQHLVPCQLRISTDHGL